MPFPPKLFRQDTYDLGVDLIPGGDDVFAHRLLKRQCRRATLSRKLERGNPDVRVDDDGQPFDRTRVRRGF